ncbi:MAG: hypothetical protein WD118_08015 [Phycisphaeraceae bacterium]
MSTSKDRMALPLAAALAAGAALAMTATVQADVIYTADATFTQPEDLGDVRVRVENNTTVTLDAPAGSWTNFTGDQQVQTRGGVNVITIRADQPDYGSLWLAYRADGADGTLNIEDAAVSFASDFQNTSAFIAAGWSGANGTTGTLNISGPSASFSASADVRVGYAFHSSYGPVSGTIKQSGGTVSIGGDLLMNAASQTAGSTGLYHVDGSGMSISVAGVLMTDSSSTLKFTLDDGGITAIGVGENQDALSGTIDLSWDGGATPTPGTYDLIVRSGGDGLIDISGLSLAAGQDALWSLDNSAEGVVQATFVPEPASLTLVGMSLTLLVSRRRGSRR